MNIGLTLKNPDTTPAGQPVLYLGRSNQLNFLITNGVGIPSLNPGDLLTINIPDNLITAANADQLLSEQWKVQQITHKNDLFSYELTPKKQIDFKGVIILSLDKLESQRSTNGGVSCSFVVDGAPLIGPIVKLFANEAPSNKLKRLHEYVKASSPYVNDEQQLVARGTVYTSPVSDNTDTDALAPPIANQIHLNLKFTGSQLINESWSRVPRFMFSFPYGNEGNDLTNAIKTGEPNYNPLTSAWNINDRIAEDQSDQWQIVPLNNNSSSPVWMVEPTSNNIHLFTNSQPDLDIIFENVITALAPENASVYIQWADIPGFNPGRYVLNLLKQTPDPQVLELTSSAINYSPQDPVVLNWMTFGLSELEMCWDDLDQTIFGQLTLPAYPSTTAPGLTYLGSNAVAGGYAIPPFQSKQTSYTCTLREPDKTETGRQVTFTLDADTPPVIEQFDVAVNMNNAGSTLEITWLVKSDNVNLYCEFTEMEGRLPLTGADGSAYTHSFPIDDDNPIPPSLTLTVKGFYPEVSLQRSLKFKVVQTIPSTYVQELSGFSNTVFINNSNNVLYYVDAFATPEELIALSGQVTVGPQDNNIACIYPDPNSNRVFVGSASQTAETLYYFDSDNIPQNAEQNIELEGYGFDSNIFFAVSSGAVFSGDGKRLFLCGVKNAEPLAISYFDPADPPTTLPQQIGFPPGVKGDQLGIFMYEIPTKNKAIACSYDTNIFPPTVNSYLFDPQDPPSILADPIPFDVRATPTLIFSPDGETAFSQIFYDGNTYIIGYFPAESPPAKVTTYMPDSIGTSTMLIHPTNGLLYSFIDKVYYYDWKNPSQPAVGSIPMLGNQQDNPISAVLLNSKIIAYADCNNNSLCYFSTEDPQQTVIKFDAGDSPFQLFSSRDGLRLFVNLGFNDNTQAVGVMEAYYE